MPETLAIPESATKPLGMRSFLLKTLPIFLILVIYCSAGIFIHHMHTLLFNLVFYMPLLMVPGYFTWLRSFYPERIPAPLPVDSPQYRKLKRTAKILIFTTVGLFVTCIAAIFTGCLCNVAFFAVHIDAILIAFGFALGLTLSTALGIRQYLHERNGPYPSPFGHWKNIPRSEQYRRFAPGEIKPFQSDHWGER